MYSKVRPRIPRRGQNSARHLEAKERDPQGVPWFLIHIKLETREMFQRIDIVDGKKWSLIRSQSQSGCDAQRRGKEEIRDCFREDKGYDNSLAVGVRHRRRRHNNIGDDEHNLTSGDPLKMQQQRDHGDRADKACSQAQEWPQM